MKPSRPESVREGGRETEPRLREQIGSTCRSGVPRLSRESELSNRGVRWRRGCYPAVTPALELVRFESRALANGRCPSVGVVTRKLL